MVSLFIIWLALHIVDNLLLIEMCNITFPMRFKKTGVNLLIFIILLLLQYFESFLRINSAMLIVINAVLLLGILLVLYIEPIRNIIFVLVVYLSILFLGEILTYQFFSIFFPVVADNVLSNARAIFIASFTSRILIICFLLLLRRFLGIKNNRKYKLDLWVWLIGIPVPILFCAVMLLYSPFALMPEEENSVLFWWCFAALAIALIYMVILITWIFKERRVREQLKQVERYASAAQDRMTLLEREQLNVRGTIHDIKNHLDYLKETSPLKQHAYIEELENRLNSRYNITGNFMIDMILHQKQEQIPGIKSFIISGTLPAIIPGLKEIDIVTVLGNSLDNAIEALREIPEGKIRISFHYDGASLVIGMENSYKGKAFGSADPPSTTKSEPGHGLGIMNIRDVVERYSGFFSLDGDGECCVLRVVLQTGICDMNLKHEEEDGHEE